MCGNLPGYQIDLFEGTINGRLSCHVAANPYGEKRGANATFAQPGQVQMPICLTRAEIEMIPQEALRRVAMSIDYDGARMQRGSLRRQIQRISLNQRRQSSSRHKKR